MLSTEIVLALIGHALVALACGWGVLAGCRWIRNQSSVLGAIVEIAVITRLTLGLALFWISYLGLPVGRSLQVSGGFWQVALDATGYFQMAARAADAARLYPLDHVVPAPFFVDVLAAWMMAVGVSPATGLFLNLCLYVGLVALVAWCFQPVNDWHRDLPCIVGVTAYSFAPVVVFHSTQPMKDELCAFLIVLAGTGVLALGRLGRRDVTTGDRWAFLGGTAAVTLATYGMGGIRWYFSFIVLFSLALTLVIFAARGRRAPLPRYLAGSLIVLFSAWVGFWSSSGPYYDLVIGANLHRIIAWDPPRDFSAREVATSGRSAVARLAAIPSDLLNMTQMTRTGFLMSGGGSNIVVPLHDDAAAGLAQESKMIDAQHASAAYQERLDRLRAEGLSSEPPPTPPASGSASVRVVEVSGDRENAAKAIPSTARDHLRTLAFGLGVVFVPVSMLKAMAGVQFSGGRGLLSIADVDTVFLDLASLVVLALLWQRRRGIRDRAPVALFGVTLSVTTAVLLGYVVTNFGTLWRMRPLVMVPLWIAIIALSPQTKGSPAASKEPVGAAEPTI